MNPHGDRVCPSCQILLPAGARTCVKCGRPGQLKTGNIIIDLMSKVHPWLIEHLGTVAGNVAAGFLLLVLLILVLLVPLVIKWFFT